jgi:hypothetical protein
MVYFQQMLKNKKRFVPLLLLSIYALLLGQEIIVNQVLCVKNNGVEAIELAVLDFQCQCKPKSPHYHPKGVEPQFQTRLVSQCCDCFDLLLEISWIERNIPNISVENKVLQRFAPNRPPALPLNAPCRRLFAPIQGSKFPGAPLPVPGSMIMRC